MQKIKRITMEHNQTQKRVVIGLLILAAGMALLLSNLGILDDQIRRYLLRWEVILIVLGFIFLLSHDKKGPGIVLLVVGGAFYIRDFIDLQFNFWQIFWPGMLILVGVMIIFRRKIDPHHFEKKNQIDSEDFIDVVNVFGGSDKTIVSQNFQGGKVTAVFGGSKFNLARARMAPGTNVIDVTAIFGGLELIVPDDWNVRIDLVPVFGGFSDKHRIRPKEGDQKPESELVIKGTVVFGGGEIRSF
jgi:predicted membrane protein